MQVLIIKHELIADIGGIGFLTNFKFNATLAINLFTKLKYTAFVAHRIYSAVQTLYE